MDAAAATTAARFTISRWKAAKVNIDCHVEFDGHYYSVPHRLVGAKLDVRVTGALLECFAANRRAASHTLSAVHGVFTTIPEHMPASHRAHLEWTPGKLIAWGERIGVSTAAVVTWQMTHRPHPEQGYRACLGLLALARKYTASRLEAACTRAMAKPLALGRPKTAMATAVGKRSPTASGLVCRTTTDKLSGKG